MENLKEEVTYKNGNLYWTKPNKRRDMNRPIGDGNTGKYSSFWFCGKQYRTHRVIFFLFHGWFPEFVDHIDGDTRNNNIENLRASNAQTNNYNRRIDKTNTSGVKGVTWSKKERKWRVQVGVNGKRKTVGTFSDIELAELVAVEYREKHHKQFARHL